jgi:aminoglycoside phosphotransferase family enzyme/predicted kinase
MEQVLTTGETTDAAAPYAEVRETHTGVVVLIGDKAYKGKKPIATEFLDFSTPQRRERACAREVELNSRLAPSSYLGIAHLSNPLGDPAEPVVVMRRHPDSWRLATMVKSGESVEKPLLAIAEVLAQFHRRAQRGRAIDSQGSVGAISARWQTNIREMERFAGTVVAADAIHEVQRLAEQFVSGRSVLFAGRISNERIVDGHADLLADDIFCLPGGPALLDCLEFDDQLRYVDTMDDAAFLAMDLEFLGRNDLGDFFLDHYSRLAEDPAPASLKSFYIAYRAVVRAKVDCIRFTQGHRDAACDASRHLDLAVEHLKAATVRLVLIGGGPGTGKTTLAHSLAKRVGACVISTDDVRRELRASGAITGTEGIPDRGLYCPDNIAAVYDTVLQRAHLQLVNGASVILDATWRNPRHRDQARQLATETHSQMLQMCCTAPLAQAKERIGHRAQGNSDATPKIAQALATADTGWDSAHRIATGRPLPDCVDEAEQLWRRRV